MAAYRLCPNTGLLLQAAKTSPTVTFVICSLCLDIGLWSPSLGSSPLLTSPVLSSPLLTFRSTLVSPLYTTRSPTLPSVTFLLTLPRSLGPAVLLPRVFLRLRLLLSGPKSWFELSTDALLAFDKVKAVLTDVTLLTHFSPDATISLVIDASNFVVGTVFQQQLTGHTQRLTFFSRKLSPVETRYSSLRWELLAILVVVKLLRIFLDGRDFTV
nr:unnamed protein product [Spirometra erinaceieuropaei]